MYHPETLEPIVTFLRGIGMGIEYGEGARNGFLPGANIRGGVMHVDPGTLVGPGDLLHEAGHIVVVPRRFWARLGSNLQVDIEALLAEATASGDPAAMQLGVAVRQGELMAQAWSYAAVLHLGLPMECLFFPGSYQHAQYEGPHPMQAWLERGTHFGPLLLAQTGLTGFSGIYAHMGGNGLPPFPHMTRWSID